MTKAPPKVDMREQILDSAARLFARNGLAATSMREIAKECGIQAGSMYNYFQSKDQIASEIFELGISRVAIMVKDATAQTDKPTDFRDVLRAAILAHLKAFFVYGDYTATHIRNFKQAPASIQANNIRARDAYERVWIRLLERGATEGFLARDVDLNLARLILLGSMNWTLEWFRSDGKYDLEEVANMVERMFLDGYRSPKPRPRPIRRQGARR